MTHSEREAFDALVKYAEMEEDWWKLETHEFVEKYKVDEFNKWDVPLEDARRLALEKAREVQGGREEPCQLCNGTGTSEFDSVPARCPACNGEGVEAEPREEVREGGE